MNTIKDVAHLARVSIATVSRVLNKTGPVRPELEERVLDAVKKLSYQPNKVARSLRRSESHTIGVLIPDSRNPFFAEMARGVEDTLFAKGYAVVLCNTDGQPEKAVSYLTTLSQQRIGGLIVVSPGRITAHLQKFLDKGYPIVIADRPITGLETDSVVSDNYAGACQAMQHLIDLGHRRIGFIMGSRDLETIQARLTGVRDTLQEASLPLDASLIYEQDIDLPQSGYSGAEALLSQTPPPTAIFAFHDFLAYGVLHYAYTHGWRIPQQLSVVGFDDIILSAYTTPSLTTVVQPKYDLGQKAAEMLLHRIEQSPEAINHLVLPVQLLVRDSTASPG